MTSADSEREELAGLVRELGVVHGRVTLASGAEADYYVDLRRVTLHHRAAPLVGRLMRVLTADWDYTAVGGLTLGADPVADAVLHAVAAEHAADPDVTPVDAFVVRKSTKEHGLQRLIEGPDVAGRRVLVVEDTSTTGGSVLTAVRAVRRRARRSSAWPRSSTAAPAPGRRSRPRARRTARCSASPTSGWPDTGPGTKRTRRSVRRCTQRRVRSRA